MVVEGTAGRVGDNGTLVRLAARWQSKIDWAFEVGDGVFLDPENSGHQALVFALAPSKVLAFTAPYSQTRYRL